MSRNSARWSEPASSAAPSTRSALVVGGMAGGRQLPQLPAPIEVLEACHPAGVLGPRDCPPVLELLKRGAEGGGVEAVGGETGSHLLGADLNLVALLGGDEHRQDRGVQRCRRFSRGPEDEQLCPFVWVERALDQRGPLAAPVALRHRPDRTRRVRRDGCPWVGPRAGSRVYYSCESDVRPVQRDNRGPTSGRLSHCRLEEPRHRIGDKYGSSFGPQ